jgi:hypothetical protein
LQEEISRKSDDTSIFCNNYYNLLARSPDQFINCGGATKGRIRSSEPYSVKNRGLKLCAAAKLTDGERPGTQDNHIDRIDLGCTLPDPRPAALSTASTRRLDPPQPSVAQYLYLKCDDQHQFRKSRYNADVTTRVSSWVDLGEEIFFISI